MRHTIVQNLIQAGAIAVVRMADAQKLMRVAEAIRAGGVTAIEITMTTPQALRVIEALATEMGDVVQVGVGSVLDAETARQAIDAGATYVVSPIFKESIIRTAHRYNVPAMPGAFTPTEVQTATEAGADIIKIFPANIVGMAFIKAIKAPMPHLQVMPTGGVTLTNAGDWIHAGACAVGVGSALLDKQAIAEGNYAKLTANAHQLLESLNSAR